MLAARANDGRGGSFTFVFGTDPGEWRPTPPNFGLDPTPWVANVRPFLVPNVEMLRTNGPNALTSNAYARDFNEVKRLGSLTSTTRTADQTAAAIFWQDSGAAIWNRVFRTLATSEELDIVESARMLAMTNLAAADGSIGCWNDKYYWNFWRPITAIHEAANDGNPATEPDPAWLPLFNPTVPVSGPPLVTPGFPDHPSGHTCISGAIAYTLKAFFGTDKVTSRWSATNALRRHAPAGASSASPPRSMRSSTPGSGAVSISARRTCKEPSLARRSPNGSGSITSGTRNEAHVAEHTSGQRTRVRPHTASVGTIRAPRARIVHA